MFGPVYDKEGKHIILVPMGLKKFAFMVAFGVIFVRMCFGAGVYYNNPVPNIICMEGDQLISSGRVSLGCYQGKTYNPAQCLDIQATTKYQNIDEVELGYHSNICN